MDQCHTGIIVNRIRYPILFLTNYSNELRHAILDATYSLSKEEDTKFCNTVTDVSLLSSCLDLIQESIPALLHTSIHDSRWIANNRRRRKESKSTTTTQTLSEWIVVMAEFSSWLLVRILNVYLSDNNNNSNIVAIIGVKYTSRMHTNNQLKNIFSQLCFKGCSFVVVSSSIFLSVESIKRGVGKRLVDYELPSSPRPHLLNYPELYPSPRETIPSAIPLVTLYTTSYPALTKSRLVFIRIIIIHIIILVISWRLSQI